MIDDTRFWALVRSLPDAEAYPMLKARANQAETIIRVAQKREDELAARAPRFDPVAFRKETLAQAPADLKAMGVSLPATRWRDAVAELHRFAAINRVGLDVVLRVLTLELLARQSWHARGAPFQPWRTLAGCAAVRVDLEPADLIEAELQVGYTLSSLLARLADLSRTEKKGHHPKP